MKPSNLTTKIFLDSGDPEDTKKMIGILGFLDGQTTNPSLVAKKLADQGLGNGERGKKLSEKELLNEYKKIVQEISSIIPQGSVSIEVYADKTTTAEQMLVQGKEMFSWIPNAHIKFPTTAEGLKAAERAVIEGMRVNMTLVFTQSQAAAVYAATKHAGKESLTGHKNIFVSP
ncbi:transaldolase, partial [Candidatus Roizmanbacteria bacterium]|nr:transaldolase [Candidatus Roizmanbacteria bacterium]